MGLTLQEGIKLGQEAISFFEGSGFKETDELKRLVSEMIKVAEVGVAPSSPVEICSDSFNNFLRDRTDAKTKPEVAAQIGRLAYCNALPRLTDLSNIRDFIACVVHGMALGIIPSAEGTRLLYGAQVAHSTLPGGRKRRKKHTKTTSNTPPDAIPTPVTATT